MTGGVVHLACAHVATLAPGDQNWLSPGERKRLAAFTTQGRRAQFIASRWLARWLLWQVHDVVPRDWVLEAPADAPPRIAGRRDLVLSISHSGDFTACALASQPVGIDLEQPARARDVEGLADLCCTPRERALMAGLAPDAREALFYELWTVKEAWLKMHGEWIAPQVLQRIEALPAREGQVRTWRCSGWTLAVTADTVKWWSAEPERHQSWRVEDLKPA